MRDWKVEYWSLLVSIVGLLVGLFIAFLQIQQHRRQSQRDERWRKQDLARQAKERKERQPSIELAFWDGRLQTALLQISAKEELESFQTNDDLKLEQQRVSEALVRAEQDDPDADPMRHDEYIEDVESYLRDFEMWQYVNRLKTQCWQIVVQFLVRNSGKVSLSNVMAEIETPSGTLSKIEEDFLEDDFFNKEKPTPPKVPRVKKPVSVADLMKGKFDPSIFDTISTIPRPYFSEMSLPSTIEVINPDTWIEDGVIKLQRSEILAGELWTSERILLIVPPTDDKRVRLAFNLHSRELSEAQRGGLEIEVV